MLCSLDKIMKFGIVFLAISCVWTVTHSAWFEYKPPKQKRVEKLEGNKTRKLDTSHYTYNRTSQGPVAIVAVDPEGRYVQLENTSTGADRRDVNLENWRIERSIDRKEKYVYTFHNFTLKAGKSLKIYALGNVREAGLGDVVFLGQSWGFGDNTVTNVFNDKNEEKASYVQTVKGV